MEFFIAACLAVIGGLSKDLYPLSLYMYMNKESGLAEDFGNLWPDNHYTKSSSVHILAKNHLYMVTQLRKCLFILQSAKVDLDPDPALRPGPD